MLFLEQTSLSSLNIHIQGFLQYMNMWWFGHLPTYGMNIQHGYLTSISLNIGEHNNPLECIIESVGLCLCGIFFQMVRGLTGGG